MKPNGPSNTAPPMSSSEQHIPETPKLYIVSSMSCNLIRLDQVIYQLILNRALQINTLLAYI